MEHATATVVANSFYVSNLPHLVKKFHHIIYEHIPPKFEGRYSLVRVPFVTSNRSAEQAWLYPEVPHDLLMARFYFSEVPQKLNQHTFRKGSQVETRWCELLIWQGLLTFEAFCHNEYKQPVYDAQTSVKVVSAGVYPDEAIEVCKKSIVEGKSISFEGFFEPVAVRHEEWKSLYDAQRGCVEILFRLTKVAEIDIPSN